jgi:GNAT superfamily N-acetyltransferase
MSLVTIAAKGQLQVQIDPDDEGYWEIKDAASGRRIGHLEVDDEGLVTGMDVDPKYRRKGVMTAVFRHLVKECGRQFWFRPHDGNRYDDASHLSGEGLGLASHLESLGLAQWLEPNSGGEE